MNDLRLLCLPDFLQPYRACAHGIHDLVREPLRQGCGVDIGTPFQEEGGHGLLPGFELSQFKALSASGAVVTPEVLWEATFHRMPNAAQDYLFAYVPEGTLLLSFYMPTWLRHACVVRGFHFLDLRYSPIRFGRDLYVDLDTSHDGLRQRLATYAVTNEELRLEASLLGANVRAHRRRLHESKRHTFTLDSTFVYASQAPRDPALLADGGYYQCPDEFAQRIATLAGDRQILFMVDYSSPYLAERANEERVSLAAKLARPVRACPQSVYQVLSTPEDVEVVGISAPMLYEAPWFGKKAHWLSPPRTEMADGPSSGCGYLQVRFADVVAPIFWHGLLSPASPEPVLKRLPALDRHHARELTDEWGDYEKVLNWERPLPWQAFERSGGIVHRRRLDALERTSLEVDRGAPLKPSRHVISDMATRIQRLKDTKVGQTAYVLGNAVSLLTLDIDKLMRKESFWFNKAFCLTDHGYEFAPPYYFLLDSAGIQSWGQEVMDIPAGVKFFSREAFSLAEKVWAEDVCQQDVVALEVNQTAGNFMFESDENFSRDPSKLTYSGYTSVLNAIQVAFYMGYSRVLVGGVELDYSVPYFYGDMLDSRGGLQDWISERTRDSFLVARRFFERNGRVLAKITPSPHLPLEYLEHIDVQRKGT